MNVTDPFDARYRATEFLVSTDPATLWSEFMIITAQNPDGQITDQARNQELHQAFLETCIDSGRETVAVTGICPNGDHAEVSVAVSCDRETARNLCARWSQLAFYAVESGEVYLVATASGQSVYVDRWSSRVRVTKTS